MMVERIAGGNMDESKIAGSENLESEPPTRTYKRLVKEIFLPSSVSGLSSIATGYSCERLAIC